MRSCATVRVARCLTKVTPQHPPRTGERSNIWKILHWHQLVYTYCNRFETSLYVFDKQKNLTSFFALFVNMLSKVKNYRMMLLVCDQSTYNKLHWYQRYCAIRLRDNIFSTLTLAVAPFIIYNIVVLLLLI